MCGIAAAIGWADSEQAVQRMLADIAHRGDVSDPVIHLPSGATLGTRRLRIVDADHGEQPKLSSDGRILVSFNGEIYNHEALRRELEALGARFQTASDTEVLANALSVWGPAALPRLEGMYAFVAVDVTSGDFLAARDPFGVKPLYLIERETGYLFCSEIRPLLRASEIGDVWLLPAGHLLANRRLIAFRTATARPVRPQPEGACELDAILRRAVHSRVPPDLPFALLFSGGLDSTLLAHYARELKPEAPGYLLGDAGAPDYEYAMRYAELTGLDLRTISLAAPELRGAAYLEAVIGALEAFEPSVVRDALCNFALFQRIQADGFRVALSGEGADELFAGYAPLEIAYADSQAAGDFVREQTLRNMSRTNLQRLDRCGMHFQVEAREPLLDTGLVEFALSAGARELVGMVDRRPEGKQPLRGLWDLYPDRLPQAIRTRRKVALHVGSGLDASQGQSPWIDYAESAVSDAEFADGKRRYAAYGLTSKEEYLYLRTLADRLDVERVPNLKNRVLVRFPQLRSGGDARAALADFLAAA